jgi:GNAT superfamily N-acetyltransferase
MNINIRLFSENDSISELTSLLHRAYKRLADMGLFFVATSISEEEAKQLIDRGECFVAVHKGKIIGTILLYPRNISNVDYYNREDVIEFGKFAVEPEYQNKGIGGMMIEYIERYVKSKGIKELALDTAEQAAHLIEYYKKRGFRFIGYHKWGRTNYRSVIMSKTL